MHQADGERRLADAAQTQHAHHPAALLHHPLRKRGYLPLAVIEARDRKRVTPIHPLPWRELSRGHLAWLGFLQRLSWQEGERRRRTAEQLRKPGLIQEHLLTRRVPEGTDLLSLMPCGKCLLLHTQLEERFEMLGFRIRAVSPAFARSVNII